MALSVMEISLQECLQKVGLKSLPAPWSAADGTKWLRGIALVNKVGGISNYALVANDNGHPSVIRDFGPCRAVLSVAAVYPYEKIERIDTPVLRNDRETVEFLSKHGYDAAEIRRLLEKDRAAVDRFVDEVAFKLAKAKLAEKDRINEIKSYASRIKTNGEEKKQPAKSRREAKKV